MRKEREQRRGLVKAHGKGITLAVIRRCRGLTQPELGEKADVSASLIALIETGRRQPSLDNADAIAKALDVPIDAIFDVNDDADADESVAQGAA